jgi:glycosyltransferase involved in cell wall biosynthesis
VVYVANARLPTEKAHGHAIVKMCEAYAAAGVEVELWHPWRRQDPRIAGRTVFDYYGVASDFRVRTLPNLDVIAVEAHIPTAAFPWVMGAHDLAWGATVAARMSSRRPAPLCHTRDVSVAWCATATGTPTVLEVHDPPAGPRRALVRHLARRHRLRGVVALTGETREALAELGVDRADVIVLGSGVDLARYADLPDALRCRALHGLPGDRPIVGYVGRYRPLGAVMGLITWGRAYGALRRSRGEAPLLLCVGGPMDHVDDYLGAGVDAGAHPEDLRFVDHVPSTEVPTWIRACDVGVIPSPATQHFSRYSSPMKLFELMACGVPVVASDLPALRETIEHERNGWLVRPESVGELAGALGRLLDDSELRRRLACTARSDVEAHTWGRRAEAILMRFGPS